jgi:hypothetical protein
VKLAFAKKYLKDFIASIIQREYSFKAKLIEPFA